MINPNNPKTELAIKIVSIAIPLAVAALFGIRVDGVDFSFLPPIYAGINAITAVLLLCSLLAIKLNKINIHKKLNQVAMILSILFLLCYVAYHMTSDSTPYGGDSKILYYFILITHITLSIIVIPLVLYSYLHAWKGDYVTHKKWTRLAWPIWFYVAVTGVIVYLMISPFYTK
jgi:putative membrane protein